MEGQVSMTSILKLMNDYREAGVSEDIVGDLVRFQLYPEEYSPERREELEKELTALGQRDGRFRKRTDPQRPKRELDSQMDQLDGTRPPPRPYKIENSPPPMTGGDIVYYGSKQIKFRDDYIESQPEPDYHAQSFSTSEPEYSFKKSDFDLEKLFSILGVKYKYDEDRLGEETYFEKEAELVEAGGCVVCEVDIDSSGLPLDDYHKFSYYSEANYGAGWDDFVEYFGEEEKVRILGLAKRYNWEPGGGLEPAISGDGVGVVIKVTLKGNSIELEPGLAGGESEKRSATFWACDFGMPEFDKFIDGLIKSCIRDSNVTLEKEESADKDNTLGKSYDRFMAKSPEERETLGKKAQEFIRQEDEKEFQKQIAQSRRRQKK